MKYALIIKGDLKLLINEGLQMEPLLTHLDEIQALNARVLEFYANLMSATAEQGRALEAEAKSLISKIGYNIVGVPFTTHDAEMYAVNLGLDYEIIELQNK